MNEENIDFYANQIAVNMNPLEVEIDAKIIRSDGNEGGRLFLRLPPALALGLVHGLSAQLDAFQEQFGEIKLPEGLVQRKK